MYLCHLPRRALLQSQFGDIGNDQRTDGACFPSPLLEPATLRANRAIGQPGRLRDFLNIGQYLVDDAAAASRPLSAAALDTFIGKAESAFRRGSPVGDLNEFLIHGQRLLKHINMAIFFDQPNKLCAVLAF
jgi:hypothetical protein